MFLEQQQEEYFRKIEEYEPIKMEERARDADMPVGLKNIGNSKLIKFRKLTKYIFIFYIQHATLIHLSKSFSFCQTCSKKYLISQMLTWKKPQKK